MIGAMRRGQGQGQGQEAGEAGDRRRELEAGGGSWRQEAGAGGRRRELEAGGGSRRQGAFVWCCFRRNSRKGLTLVARSVTKFALCFGRTRSRTMRTRSFATQEIDKQWFVVDVEGVPLGRAAARIAMVLRGKHKPQYTPHADTGDYVVVVNADKATLTGLKAERESWRWHTGYVGHLRSRTLGHMMASKPEFMMRKAIKGMLPRGPLGRKMLTKLKVYSGSEHPHDAQQPKALDLSKV